LLQTGPVAISGPDPSSTRLAREYSRIGAAWRERGIDDDGGAWRDGLRLTHTRSLVTPEQISTMFWL
jgi:hypothetical protein